VWCHCSQSSWFMAYWCHSLAKSSAVCFPTAMSCPILDDNKIPGLLASVFFSLLDYRRRFSLIVGSWCPSFYVANVFLKIVNIMASFYLNCLCLLFYCFFSGSLPWFWNWGWTVKFSWCFPSKSGIGGYNIIHGMSKMLVIMYKYPELPMVYWYVSL